LASPFLSLPPTWQHFLFPWLSLRLILGLAKFSLFPFLLFFKICFGFSTYFDRKRNLW